MRFALTAVIVLQNSDHAEFLADEALMGGDEVETLLNIAIGRCVESVTA